MIPTHEPVCATLNGWENSDLYKAEAEEEAQRGNYEKCAESLGKQKEALEKRMEGVANVNIPGMEKLSRSIAADLDFCKRRQKHFADLAQKQPPPKSFTKGTIAFVIVTLLSLYIMPWCLKRSKVKISPAMAIVIMVFSLVLGGIGAGLASWGEGTNFFKQMIGEVVSSFQSGPQPASDMGKNESPRPVLENLIHVHTLP